MTGIYVVVTESGRRLVVLAPTAHEAALRAAHYLGGAAGGLDATRAEAMAARYEVGRLGSYDPGIEGARLAGAGSVVAA